MSFDSYTKLVCHYDGADASTPTPAATGQTITYVGTAQASTAQKIVGSASLLLDGDSDYTTVPESANWDFGTGDFTVECWFRPTAKDVDSYLMSQYISLDNRWYIVVNAANKILIQSSIGGSVVGAYITSSAIPSYAANQWWHIAAVRNGATVYLFANGVSLAVTEATAWTGAQFGHLATALVTGSYLPVAHVHTAGYIDEVRISKGIARWTADFTPRQTGYGEGGNSRGIII